MILGSLPRVHYWRTNEARASDEIWTPIRGCGFSGVASFFSHTVARRPPSPNSRFHPIRIPVNAPDRFPSNGIKRNPPRFRPCSGSGSSSRLSTPGTLGTQDASRSTPLKLPRTPAPRTTLYKSSRVTDGLFDTERYRKYLPVSLRVVCHKLLLSVGGGKISVEAFLIVPLGNKAVTPRRSRAPEPNCLCRAVSKSHTRIMRRCEWRRD